MEKQFNKLIMNAFSDNIENTKFIKLCLAQRKGKLIDEYFDYIDNIIKKIHNQLIKHNKCYLFKKKYTYEETINLEYNLSKAKIFIFFNDYYISDNLDSIICSNSKVIDELYGGKILKMIICYKRWDILKKINKQRFPFFATDNYIKNLSIDECYTVLNILDANGITLNHYFLSNKNMILAILSHYQNKYRNYIIEAVSRDLWSMDKEILLPLINLIDTNKIDISYIDRNIDVLVYYLENGNKDKIKQFSKKLFDRHMPLIMTRYSALIIQILTQDESFVNKLTQSEVILEYYLKQNNREIVKKFEWCAFNTNIINNYAGIIYEIYKDNRDFFENCLSDKQSILEYCLYKGEYNYLIYFEKGAFTKEIINENIDEIIKNTNYEWISKVLCDNSDALLYCLEKKKYYYIDAFSIKAFNDTIINRYMPIILEIGKKNKTFFNNVLSYSKEILLYCIQKGQINYVKAFKGTAFTNDILKEYLDIIFTEIKKNQSLLLYLLDNTMLLEYCLEKQEYDMVKKFDYQAFTDEIFQKYAKTLFNIFKDDNKYLKKFSKNIYMLEYCLENEASNKNISVFDPSLVFNFLINCDDENKMMFYFMKLFGMPYEKSMPLLNYLLQAFNNLFGHNQNISFTDIIQYGFNSSKYPNWKHNLALIIKNNKTLPFTNVMCFLGENYYAKNNDKMQKINYFLEMLSNYEKYQKLLINLTSKKTLTNSEKGKINYLFNLDTSLLIENIDDVEKNLIKLKQSVTKTTPLNRIKYVLNTLLFGKGNLTSFLSNINTEQLKILKFNNQNNEDVVMLIDELLIYVSMIEEINNCNDRKVLSEMLDRCDIKECLEIFNILSKLPELVRYLYEFESEKNLTKLEDISSEYIIQKDGINYIDLRDKQYILYAHTKSHSETISEICEGTTNKGKHNFICLSPISHRNQKYYFPYGDKIIFAYDHVCKGSFIKSSDINLSSNSLISEGSMDVKAKNIINPKGILETSEARHSSNAEALFYRENMKPCGIIIPEDRKTLEPTKEELEIAKQYHLSIIYTQEIGKTIPNPKRLTFHDKKVMDASYNLEQLKQMKAYLLNKFPKESNKKQYGIITDIHAMYEPALACLEDMRKKGITEIYSLGDNIGAGPNPKEVMELLREYKVKSIMGNHELYALASKEGKNIKDVLPEHVAAHNQKNQDVATWTGNQIDKVEEYPFNIELTSSSGQKALLIHSTDKTVYGRELPDLSNINLVICGHKHFESKRGNIITLRAAGIGDMGSGLASYAILSEDENGDFVLNAYEIAFDRENLLHDVNESSLPDKTDIHKFLGKKM